MMKKTLLLTLPLFALALGSSACKPAADDVSTEGRISAAIQAASGLSRDSISKAAG